MANVNPELRDQFALKMKISPEAADEFIAVLPDRLNSGKGLDLLKLSLYYLWGPFNVPEVEMPQEITERMLANIMLAVHSEEEPS